MGNILLTATMPNYNYDRYLEQALIGITTQSRMPEEIIIIDDGSTDKSHEILNKYRDTPGLTIIKHEKNMGLVATCQELLSMARGSYLVTTSSDDYWLQGYIQKSMSILLDNPQAGLCCSNPRFHFEESGSYSDHFFQWSTEPCYIPPDTLAGLIEQQGWYPETHTCFYKRDAFFEAGGYRPELGHNVDQFYNLVIAFRHGICYVPEVLSVRRMHKNTFTANNSSESENHAIIKNYFKFITSYEYADVYPYFVRSSAVSMYFKEQVAETILANPELWEIKYLMLGLQSLWQHFSKVTAQRENRYNRSWQYEQLTKIRKHVDAGNNALNENRHDEALRIFTEILNVAPQLPEAYAGISSVFIATGNYLEAQKVIDLAFQRNLSDSSLWRNLGKLKMLEKDFTGAQDAFGQALASMSDDVELLVSYGESLVAQGKMREAVAHYRLALASKSNHAGLWAAAGKTALAAYDKEFARLAFHHSLELQPSNQEIQRLYSFVKG